MADFERGVEELAGMATTPLNGPRDPGYDDRLWDAVRKVEHFYGRLAPMPGAKAMFDALWMRYGKRCKILTGIPKPRRNIAHAAEEKREWARRELCGDIVVNVVLREQKPDYCTGPDCVLIDDSVRNIREWEQMKGTGILYTDAEAVLWALTRLEGSELLKDLRESRMFSEESADPLIESVPGMVEALINGTMSRQAFEREYRERAAKSKFDQLQMSGGLLPESRGVYQEEFRLADGIWTVVKDSPQFGDAAFILAIQKCLEDCLWTR